MDGYAFEDLQVGQFASLGTTITDADILMFAALSLDTNPVHMDAEAAAGSVFKERVAHGMLSAGLIGAVMGTRLPGNGTADLEQTLRFRRLVRIGDTVTATVEVIALDPAKLQATLRTVCRARGKVAMDGEAVVLPRSRG